LKLKFWEVNTAGKQMNIVYDWIDLSLGLAAGRQVCNRRGEPTVFPGVFHS
jgi:hypothetical protein